MHPLSVYRASAGSGKTFTLAVHYIKLLLLAEGGGEYAHILGVTFTNKATTEMKDRIVTQLYGIANALPMSDSYLAALRKALAEEGVTMSDAEMRRRCGVALSQILHDYSRFRVQTIDAFFQSVLRGLAHELGLTANLQVEISDSEVLAEAVDRIVDRLETEPLVLQWIKALVRDQIENNRRWDVTQHVKNFGRTIFSEDYQLRGGRLRELLDNPEATQRAVADIRTEESGAIAALRDWGNRLEEALAGTDIAATDFSRGSNLTTLIQRLKEADLGSLKLGKTIENWAADPLSMVKKADQARRPELVAAADVVSALLADMLQDVPRQQRRYNSSRLALAHLTHLRLLDVIDREVTLINTETSRFTLAKTPILLSQMIGQSDAPFIFERIGAQLHHIMIDEFQDTSSLQWNNFRPLLAECRSRGGRNLIVGDVKQSIYRFRGGDWRTLAYIQDSVQPGPDVVTMDTNFRSERNIVEFNSTFFQTAVGLLDDAAVENEMLAGGRFSFSEAYADVRQEASPKRREAVGEGYVRVALPVAGDGTSAEAAEAQILEDMCRQVRTLHAAGIDYADMTILVRYNSESEAIMRAFAADETMPPIVSDEAFLLSASRAVCIIIEALRVLGGENDAIARYYLHHRLPVADDMEWFEASAARLRRTPLPELVEELYRGLHLADIPSQDAYMMAFLDALDAYLHSSTADIQSFVAFWDERLYRQSIPASTGPEGIRIITIHKSKGLEFNTVLMPFCNWRLEDIRSDDIIWCAPEEQPYAAFSLLPVSPTKMAANSVFARDYAEEHLNARLDELNVLYVALTRARANLLLWATGKEEASSTVGDLIASTLPLCPDMRASQDGSLQLYTIGEPYLRHSREEDYSRVNPRRMPVNVAMCSYDARLPFRQSNRSASFFAADADADALAADEELRQTHYLEFGRLIHTILQDIATTDDIPRVLDTYEHEGVICRTTADGSYVSIRRDDLERRIRRALNDPRVAAWYDPAWQLFTECSIVSRDRHGRPRTLRPDRVIVSPDASRIIVVDFKTARHNEDYIGQVQDYMSLLQAMYPTADVKGFLWYILAEKVVPVEPRKSND